MLKVIGNELVSICRDCGALPPLAHEGAEFCVDCLQKRQQHNSQARIVSRLNVCLHEQTTIKGAPYPHRGKVVCATCGKFRKWAKAGVDIARVSEKEESR